MMSMQNVTREIEKMMKNAIVALASKYNFDAEEGMRMIWESEGLISSSRSRNKKVSNKKEKRSVVKSAFPLPYNGEVNGECCMGIRQNSGLYTQCPSIRPEGSAYCGACNKQATKNEHGLPDYGSIQTRSSKYFKDEEFVDPSGKKPVAYTKVMKKLKLTEEQVREEAAKHNMVLDPRHFIEVEKKSGRPAKVVTEKEPKETKPKGRPKKSKKVLELAGEEEDLFASLVMSSLVPSATNKVDGDVIEETVTSEVSSVAENESEVDDNSSLGDVDVVVEAKTKPTKPKAVKVSPEEKKLALQKAKEEKKLALEKEKEEKKLALQKEKDEKKLALEKEKEAKKFLKELEKQEKQAIAEIKKENKEKKETKKETKKEPKKEAKVESEEEADVVKKIEFEGKKYLKSKKTGIIYNMDQDVIGKWNESKQRIDFNETGEESEEDYDEDDN